MVGGSRYTCPDCARNAKLIEATNRAARDAERARQVHADRAEAQERVALTRAVEAAQREQQLQAALQAERAARHAAEQALQAERQARRAAASAASVRATRCPWCGASATHDGFVDCVDADEALAPLGDGPTSDAPWNEAAWSGVAAKLQQLAARLADTERAESGAYPYCTKKCRHAARGAGDEDATSLPRLVARRAALHARVVAVCARGEARRADAAARARAAAEAAQAALAEAEAQRIRVWRHGALVSEERARASVEVVRLDHEAALANVERAAAAASTWFGRLAGGTGRLAAARAEAERRGVTRAIQEATWQAAQDAVTRADAALAGHSVEASREVAENADARRMVLRRLDLQDAPPEVQHAVLGCVLGCVLGVVCPPGTFDMGSPATEPGRQNSETLHRVTLTRAFTMGAYPVVQALWQAVTGTNPSRFKGPTLPVEQVSWEDCAAFCTALSARLGLPADAFRLPTEAEWEYAARAGQQTTYAGGDDLDALGWYAGNSGGQTRPVGQKRPNAWGLYDMSGNVWEWCADVYEPYPAGPITDPTGPSSGPDRVYRGGSWYGTAVIARAARRFRVNPGDRDGNLGLRLSRTIP